MMKKRVWIPAFFFVMLILSGVYLYFFRSQVAGVSFEPFLEKYLTQMFGTQVKITRLRWDPKTGVLTCKRFQVMNQPAFSRQPHIDAQDFHGVVDMKEIWNKKVWIRQLEIGQLHYLIERVHDPQAKDTRTNCRVMVWAIKDYKKNRPPSPQPKAPATGPSWQVLIDRIIIQNGSFTYDNRIPGSESRLVFAPLHGELIGLDIPTQDQNVMDQDVWLEGLFGEKHKVPFKIQGKANFATNNLSFKLDGRIEEGPVEEYSHFWSGIPVEIRDGKFILEVKSKYVGDYFDSMNQLDLKSLKVTGGKNVVEKIWGSPAVVFVKFIESQERITLNIPVHGDITDPNFEVSKAFRKAFQKSLKNHTKRSIKLLQKGTTKIAEGTTEFAQKASEKINFSIACL